MAAIGWVMYEGLNITKYAHVDGEGGGRSLEGEWSNPWNTTHNTLCTTWPSAPAGMQCPQQCSASTNRVSKKRVRKAVGTMPEDEWQRVVKALWIMRTLTEEEGQAKYGTDYRSMDYFNMRHYTGALPRPKIVSVTHENHTFHVMQTQTDVTGGGAQTYTYHGLFSMELETALLVVDPEIPGLPYLDWTDPVNTARRLGVADAKVDEMNLQYSCHAWKTSCTEIQAPGLGDEALYNSTCAMNGGSAPCLERKDDCCALAALGDGDLAWWPVPQFNVSSFCESSTPTVRELLCTPALRAAVAQQTASSRGQLRPNPRGHSLYSGEGHASEAAYDGPIPYVLRYDGGYEAWIGSPTAQELWTKSIAACLALDNGMYQDVSECIEGRMAANDFSIHLELHSIGGDMSLAMVPHDPIFLFHHNGLDRLRRQWQAKNPQMRRLAYGYPIEAKTYTSESGTEIGLYDCLGCMAEGAGYTKELLLGSRSGVHTPPHLGRAEHPYRHPLGRAEHHSGRSTAFRPRSEDLP